MKESILADIKFVDLNQVSKELVLIKMNFEAQEMKFKKELWILKSLKLITKEKFDTAEKKE